MFEAVFPYVRAGGVFVIEDWSWSHEDSAQTPSHFWESQDSPTSLIFQLIAAYGATNSLISAIGFAAGLMWVVKNQREVPKEGFALEEYMGLRRHAFPLI